MSDEQTLTYTNRPWPDGPWMDEPDRVLWTDPTTGYDCLVRRQATRGHLCGYVGVPLSHPAARRAAEVEYCFDAAYDVHGGITYTAECDGDPVTGVCHIAQPGDEDEVYWFGFDMAHLGDLSPRAADRRFGELYRTVEYVQAECRSLAAQLAEVTS